MERNAAELHKAMVEQALHGYDVQPSAVHFAATKRLKHGDVAVPEIDALAELLRQSPLPNAGNQDENDVGASCVVVLRCGFQPVVEGTAAAGPGLGGPRRSCGRRGG